MDQAQLKADARNRSIRSLVQGLVFDTLVAVAMIIIPIFTTATAWEDLDWKLLGFLVFKSIIVSVFSYLMRLRTSYIEPPAQPALRVAPEPSAPQESPPTEEPTSEPS